jgi:hypothetical protein
MTRHATIYIKQIILIKIMYLMNLDGENTNIKLNILRYIYLFFTIPICMLLLATTCNKEDENCHKHINIVNNSDGDIYYSLSFRYPDTITLYPNPTSDPHTSLIDKNSEKKDISRSCFEANIKLNSEGKIMYFIYNANTLETVPWDTVVKYYMILERYDLSLEDLESMDWTLTYPPLK